MMLCPTLGTLRLPFYEECRCLRRCRFMSIVFVLYGDGRAVDSLASKPQIAPNMYSPTDAASQEQILTIKIRWRDPSTATAL